MQEDLDSASPASAAPPLDSSDPGALQFDDIQGLVLRGYSYFFIRYFILKIADVEGARKFCALVAPGSGSGLQITTAEPWGDPPPTYCLNIGLTNTGLGALLTTASYAEVKKHSYSLFNPFDEGAVKRAGKIGDIDESAPGEWWPANEANGGDGASQEDMDILVCLYTGSAEDRETWSQRLLDMIPSGADGKPALASVYMQDADKLDAPEEYNSGIQIHFGYSDGFSQPQIVGAPTADRKDYPGNDVEAAYFAIATGEPAKKCYYQASEFLANGSFAAFRLLYQDVPAFEAYLNGAAEEGVDPELLAAKMCGRWRNGTPLIVNPDGPETDLSPDALINFNYIEPTANQAGIRKSDAEGLYCPYGAHMRRTNPRDDGDVITPGFVPRIRRFATPFGPLYEPPKDGNPGNADTPRGLVGLFICASLYQQFEFLMQTWINGSVSRTPDDSPNGSGIDPLFGPHVHDPFPPDRVFAFNKGDEGYRSVPGLTRFIVTKGSLYVFLPSVKALDCLATGGHVHPPKAEQ